jgi:hypothetical protein
MNVSPNQNTVEVCGTMAAFVANPESAYGGRTCCDGCFFEATPALCRSAPCMGSERKDGQNGRFKLKAKS